jgi:hypothetical protein
MLFVSAWRWTFSRATRPYQHFTVFVDGQALGLDELGFQVLQVLVVKVEAAFERTIGSPPLALEQLEHLA